MRGIVDDYVFLVICYDIDPGISGRCFSRSSIHRSPVFSRNYVVALSSLRLRVYEFSLLDATSQGREP